MRVLGLESGTFRGLHRPEALCAFWRLQRAGAKGEGRLRAESNRVGLGSGESIEGPRRSSGRYLR
jgi:hypothetical protein